MLKTDQQCQLQQQHSMLGAKMGSRRIFPAQFKLQVLSSYRNDSDCRGNQRATARKYGIHRRQIQKWLQCEEQLRSNVVLNCGGISKARNISNTYFTTKIEANKVDVMPALASKNILQQNKSKSVQNNMKNNDVKFHIINNSNISNIKKKKCDSYNNNNIDNNNNKNHSHTNDNVNNHNEYNSYHNDIIDTNNNEDNARGCNASNIEIDAIDALASSSSNIIADATVSTGSRPSQKIAIVQKFQKYCSTSSTYANTKTDTCSGIGSVCHALLMQKQRDVITPVTPNCIGSQSAFNTIPSSRSTVLSPPEMPTGYFHKLSDFRCRHGHSDNNQDPIRPSPIYLHTGNTSINCNDGATTFANDFQYLNTARPVDLSKYCKSPPLISGEYQSAAYCSSDTQSTWPFYWQVALKQTDLHITRSGWIPAPCTYISSQLNNDMDSYKIKFQPALYIEDKPWDLSCTNRKRVHSRDDCFKINSEMPILKYTDSSSSQKPVKLFRPYIDDNDDDNIEENNDKSPLKKFKLENPWTQRSNSQIRQSTSYQYSSHGSPVSGYDSASSSSFSACNDDVNFNDPVMSTTTDSTHVSCSISTPKDYINAQPGVFVSSKATMPQQTAMN